MGEIGGRTVGLIDILKNGEPKMSNRSRISILVVSLFFLSLFFAGRFTSTVKVAHAAFQLTSGSPTNGVMASVNIKHTYLPAILSDSSVISTSAKRKTPTPNPVVPTATTPPILPTATTPPILPTATTPPILPTATISPSSTPAISPLTKIYYVSTVGSDTNPGTSTSPWRTIQKAANTMIAGDTVYIQAGDYSTQRVNISRSGSAGALINYQAQGTVVMKGFNITASYIGIRGFEIANTIYRRWDFGGSAGVYIQGGNNVIENNNIHDASLTGIYFYGTPTDQTTAHDNIIRNNKIFHNELVGIHLNGANNLIEGNDISGTVQCHPTLMAVENVASDNNGATCPNYPAINSLDADGMRFFGTGHKIRKNYIHDISFGPVGINLSVGDYNDTPHIDCWQTWNSGSWGPASNIIFDGNFCDNLQVQALNASASGFMLAGGVNNLTIINNILRTYSGINASGGGGANHLYIYNNIFQNSLSFSPFYPGGIELSSSIYSQVKNNIFYDQPLYTVSIYNDATGIEADNNLAYNSDGSSPHCISNSLGCVPINHNLWKIDPQFVDLAAKNYHLKSTSPAINTGVTLAQPTTDYDGVSRPQGGKYDIGVYEQ